MMGTRDISGSEAIKFKNRTMAAWLSNMASSMLMSMICAPFSTCWRATLRACSKSPLKIMRAKALEPVTLVRSPTFTNRLLASSETGSKPDKRKGGGVAGVAGFSVAFIGDLGSGWINRSPHGQPASPRPAPRGRSGERGFTRQVSRPVYRAWLPSRLGWQSQRSSVFWNCRGVGPRGG